MISQIINACLVNLQYRRFDVNGDACIQPLQEKLLAQAAIELIVGAFTRAGLYKDAMGRYLDENGDLAVNAQSNDAHSSRELPFAQPTLASFAASRGDITLMRWLQQQGADMARASHAHSTMHIAAEYGNTEMIDFLHGVGVDINQRAYAGESDMYVGDILPVHTPLHRAIRFGSVVAVRHLLRLGAKLMPEYLPMKCFKEVVDANIQARQALEKALGPLMPAIQRQDPNEAADEATLEAYHKIKQELETLPSINVEEHALIYANTLLSVLAMNPYSEEYQRYFGHGHHRDFNRVPSRTALQEIILELDEAEIRLSRSYYAFPLFQWALKCGTDEHHKAAMADDALFDCNVISTVLDMAAGLVENANKRNSPG